MLATDDYALGELRAFRCGRSLSSKLGTAWSVHVITSQSRLAFEYSSEALMQADLDAVRALCPEVTLLFDDVEVPSDAETTPVFERCTRERNVGLGAAAFLGVSALIALPFGASDVAAFFLLVFACVCVCIAGFRVTHALTGAAAAPEAAAAAAAPKAGLAREVRDRHRPLAGRRSRRPQIRHRLRGRPQDAARSLRQTG
jgi:hypothetical protein